MLIHSLLEGYAVAEGAFIPNTRSFLPAAQPADTYTDQPIPTAPKLPFLRAGEGGAHVLLALVILGAVIFFGSNVSFRTNLLLTDPLQDKTPGNI